MRRSRFAGALVVALGCGAAPGAPVVTLRFTIGAEGVVLDAEALEEGGAASSHAAYARVLAELRTLRFPTDMAGLIVTYPLR